MFNNEQKITLICIILLFISFLILIIVDIQNKQNAIERCGNENNIITKYTSTGDKYYICKK